MHAEVTELNNQNPFISNFVAGELESLRFERGTRAPWMGLLIRTRDASPAALTATNRGAPWHPAESDSAG